MAKKNKKTKNPSGAIEFDQYMKEEYGKPGTKKRTNANKKLNELLVKGNKSIPQISKRIIEKVQEGGYIAYIEGIPGINSQGETKAKAQKNLLDALKTAVKYKAIGKKKVL